MIANIPIQGGEGLREEEGRKVRMKKGREEKKDEKVYKRKPAV